MFRGLRAMGGCALLLWLAACSDAANRAQPVPDTTPPGVSDTAPAHRASLVPVSGVLTVTLSEPVDPASVTAGSFLLIGNRGPVSGTLGVSGTTVTFTPQSVLAHNTLHTATLTSAVKDIQGNALAASHTWTFTTVPPPGAPLLSLAFGIKQLHFS